MTNATLTAIERAQGAFVAALTGFKVQTTDVGPRCTITLVVEGNEANEVAHNLARLRRGMVNVIVAGYKEATQLRLWAEPVFGDWPVGDEDDAEASE